MPGEAKISEAKALSKSLQSQPKRRNAKHWLRRIFDFTNTLKINNEVSNFKIISPTFKRKN
jgi:hypothetical protein